MVQRKGFGAGVVSGLCACVFLQMLLDLPHERTWKMGPIKRLMGMTTPGCSGAYKRCDVGRKRCPRFFVFMTNHTHPVIPVKCSVDLGAGITTTTISI